MKVLNCSERIFDLGTFKIHPGHRPVAVPAEMEKAVRKVVSDYPKELEIVDESPAKAADDKDAKIAKLEAELAALKKQSKK